MYDHPCEYHEPYPNRYKECIDNACLMLECPECKCRIQAYPFSYAVGTNGYKFCPYCGADVRLESDTKSTLNKKGHWEPIPCADRYRCSCCKSVSNLVVGAFGIVIDGLSPFCPDCGADLREEYEIKEEDNDNG